MLCTLFTKLPSSFNGKYVYDIIQLITTYIQYLKNIKVFLRKYRLFLLIKINDVLNLNSLKDLSPIALELCKIKKIWWILLTSHNWDRACTNSWIPIVCVQTQSTFNVVQNICVPERHIFWKQKQIWSFHFSFNIQNF